MNIEEYKVDLEFKEKLEKYRVTTFMKCFEFLIKTGYNVEEAFSTSLYYFKVEFSDVLHIVVHKFYSGKSDVIYILYKSNKHEHLNEFFNFVILQHSIGPIYDSFKEIKIDNKYILNFLIKKFNDYCKDKDIESSTFYRLIDEELPF